jgi:hypothetical protein
MHCQKGYVKDGTQHMYGKVYNKCIRKKVSKKNSH